MELPGGVVTPGVDDPRDRLPLLRLPEDMSGLSVLDVGAWDGFFSFECERRGAEPRGGRRLVRLARGGARLEAVVRARAEGPRLARRGRRDPRRGSQPGARRHLRPRAVRRRPLPRARPSARARGGRERDEGAPAARDARGPRPEAEAGGRVLSRARARRRPHELVGTEPARRQGHAGGGRLHGRRKGLPALAPCTSSRAPSGAAPSRGALFSMPRMLRHDYRHRRPAVRSRPRLRRGRAAQAPDRRGMGRGRVRARRSRRSTRPRAT